MNHREHQNLAYNLTMIGMILFVIFSSCSVPIYYTGRHPDSEPAMQRYQITEKDLAEFTETLRPRRQDPDTLYRQAIFLQRSGKHRLALQLLEEAILANSAFYKAYNAMGVSYGNLGDYPRAIEAYKRALKLNPNLAYVHNNLGYSYLQQGDVDAAIDAFKAALALDFQNARYHNNLGLAYAQKGLYEPALAEFKSAGSNAKAHYNIARIYARAGDKAKAQVHFSESKIETAGRPPERNLPGSNPFADTADVQPDGMDSNQTGKNNDHPAKSPAGTKENYTIAYAGYRLLEDLPKIDTKIHPQKRNGSETIEVEISNGNGVNHMAARVGHYLKKNGLNVSRLTNAEHFNFPTTRIYYDDDYLQEASNVAMYIPGYQNMERVTQFNPSNIKVKVLIGKDLIPYDQLFSQ
jgi:tetratricopeptide (TPR) repeat protein